MFYVLALTSVVIAILGFLGGVYAFLVASGLPLETFPPKEMGAIVGGAAL